MTNKYIKVVRTIYEMNDKRVTDDILRAKSVYEDGGILEAREILSDIVEAIDLYDGIMEDEDGLN